MTEKILIAFSLNCYICVTVSKIENFNNVRGRSHGEFACFINRILKTAL